MQKAGKALCLIISLLLMIPILTGCQSDEKEPDDQVYTLAIGVDKGITNKLRLTVQFPTYKGSGSSSGSQQQKGGSEVEGEVSGTIVETVEAPTIIEAFNLMNTSVSRHISMIHAKSIIFSEEVAKEGIGSYLQLITRYREGRRIMQIVVCRGSAQAFIKENITAIGESMSKTMELMETQADNSGFFPRISFQTFYTNMLSTYQQSYAIYAGLNDFKNIPSDNRESTSPLITQNRLLPGEIPRIGGRKVEFIGTAVFNGDKMVGGLNSCETRYFLMLIGEFQRAAISIDDINAPGKAISLDVRLGRQPKIKAHFENGVPVIDIKLNIEADIGTIQSRIPYELPNKIDQLNKMLKNNIEEGTKNVIEKTQREWNVDIFGFGLKVAHNFNTIQEFEAYNWLKHFKDAKVNVVVDANVRRSGLMYDRSPIRNNEGTENLAGDK